MDYLLLLVSFAIVLAGALLFTGAVEWIGHELKVGEGAVGSILAAVGTATPETLIAIVALIQAEEGSEDVAIGAIARFQNAEMPSCPRWPRPCSSNIDGPTGSSRTASSAYTSTDRRHSYRPTRSTTKRRTRSPTSNETGYSA